MTPKELRFVEAIRAKQRLSCTYHGKRRVIEPQCYGLGRKGLELLRVHQISGGEQPEPLFYAQEIEDLEVVGTFTSPGPNYRRDDSAMAMIFAQL